MTGAPTPAARSQTPASRGTHGSGSVAGAEERAQQRHSAGTLTIRSTGAIALLEDRGRAGLAHLGVGHAGAADLASHDLANRLVGNSGDAACIEATLGA